MRCTRRISILLGAFVVLGSISASWRGRAQESAPPASAEPAHPLNDQIAALSPENRTLFEAIREAAEKGRDADVLANCKKLLPALKPDSELANFITQLAAGAALETGDISLGLTLLKPVADAHPDDWHAAALLARLYAESGQKTLLDQQIAHVLALHRQTSDPAFAKLHIFPVQKVKLHSGYAMFLYPFEPLKPNNIYLVALIYTSDDQEDSRLELESMDVDQAFFKAKEPGERRFSIDSFRESDADGKQTESQALHGFVDGVFDYDRMRDLMVKVANGEKLPQD